MADFNDNLGTSGRSNSDDLNRNTGGSSQNGDSSNVSGDEQIGGRDSGMSGSSGSSGSRGDSQSDGQEDIGSTDRSTSDSDLDEESSNR